MSGICPESVICFLLLARQVTQGLWRIS